MLDETHVELLRQARDSLDAYLFADMAPSYDRVLELCKRIDELLPEGDSLFPKASRGSSAVRS